MSLGSRPWSELVAPEPAGHRQLQRVRVPREASPTSAALAAGQGPAGACGWKRRRGWCHLGLSTEPWAAPAWLVPCSRAPSRHVEEALPPLFPNSTLIPRTEPGWTQEPPGDPAGLREVPRQDPGHVLSPLPGPHSGLANPPLTPSSIPSHWPARSHLLGARPPLSAFGRAPCLVTGAPSPAIRAGNCPAPQGV